jgi:catechol 2,3-dioxygenase-like lactoylglutathione lyase family enzyme
MDLGSFATMLCVRDLDGSTAFYRDRLGFDLVHAEPHVALLRRGPGVLYLFTESPPTDDKPTVHLAPPVDRARPSVVLVLIVEDCRAAYAELNGRGVEFLTPPKQPPWGGWRCFALDPDGYVIEVEDAAAELLAT